MYAAAVIITTPLEPGYRECKTGLIDVHVVRDAVLH